LNDEFTSREAGGGERLVIKDVIYRDQSYLSCAPFRWTSSGKRGIPCDRAAII